MNGAFDASLKPKKRKKKKNKKGKGQDKYVTLNFICVLFVIFNLLICFLFKLTIQYLGSVAFSNDKMLNLCFRLLDWVDREDKASKLDRIVVIKNMFDPVDFDVRKCRGGVNFLSKDCPR